MARLGWGLQYITLITISDLLPTLQALTMVCFDALPSVAIFFACRCVTILESVEVT